MNKKSVFSYLACLLFLLLSSSFSGRADEAWPREIKTNKATVVIYQPQIERFSGDQLEARAALAVTLKSTGKPVFGAAWFDCRVDTDRDTRMVVLKELEVKSIKFPEAGEQDLEQLTSLLESHIPKWTLSFSLDRLLAELAIDDPASKGSESLNNIAPEIIFETNPSVLVPIDGDPILQEIEGLESYSYVVNTPFFVAINASGSRYYLYGDQNWHSSDNLQNSWRRDLNVPGDLVEFMEQIEARKEKSEDMDNSAVATASNIYVRTKPAELLQSKGEPQYRAIEGTNLLYMSNTENDILMDINTQMYYVLIAGRWYASGSLTDNQWEFISNDQLPGDFSGIPEGADIGSVRSSVSGTPESKEALLDNTVPQTAEIDRHKASLEVNYDGDPSFVAIGGTSVFYAENTDKSVLRIDDLYYCCDDAVWFVSGNPSGPWKVCVEVPTEVQSIPPESPVYNVKYVYIYDYTPDVVYVGYTPGYVGSYAYHGCVVYGTGYYYRPWYGTYYYPRPVTYGFGVHYNPYTGWGFSFGVSHGWFHYGYGWGSPYYRGYWGPAGYHYGYRHGYARGYHRGYAAGVRAGYYQGSRAGKPKAYSNNVYSKRATGVKSTAKSSRRSPPTARNTITSKDQVRKSGNGIPRKNNVYADTEGNIHRRTENGWQKRENGEWKDNSPSRKPQGEPKPANRSKESIKSRESDRRTGASNTTGKSQDRRVSGTSPVTKPSTSGRNYENLNKSAQSRTRGTQKAQNYNKSVRSGAATRSSKPPARSGSATRRR